MISKGVKESLKELKDALKLDRNTAVVALVADLDDHDMASVLNGHESDMLAMIAGALLIMQDQGGMDAYTAVRLIKKFTKHTHIKVPNDDD